MTWSDIKHQVKALSPRELVALVGALYKLSHTNRDFLAARFGAKDQAIEPYRTTINACMYPDTNKTWAMKLGEARRAIREYSLASGDIVGTADLKVYSVECGIEFCSDYSYVDDSLQRSLLGFYSEAISAVHALPERDRAAFRERLAKTAEASEYDPVFSELIYDLYDNAFD